MKITLLAIVLALTILLLWTDPIEGRGGRGGGGRGGSGRGGSGRGRGGTGRGRGTSGGGSNIIIRGPSFGFNGNNSNSTRANGELTGIIIAVILGPMGIMCLGIFVWLYCFPKFAAFKLKLKRQWKNTKNWLKSKFRCRVRVTQNSTTTADIKLQAVNKQQQEEAPPTYDNCVV